MNAIPSNVSQLDPFLQQYIKQKITLKEDDVKEANEYLKNVLLDVMLNEMKRVDETFREMYRQPHFVGSYYENLRVGKPCEFDINLELQLPISESNIEIQTTGTEPGFAKIRVNTQFHTHTSAAVKKKIESCLEDGYLCRDRIIQWLEGVVDRARKTVNWPQNITVSKRISGPAVTLIVRKNTEVFEVDVVPVFSFGKNQWPPKPTRQLSSLPWQISPYLKWCVVPKPQRQNSHLRYQWRMSFYMYEKEMMNNQNNMKPVLKLMKLLRDRQNWVKISSYYIKTMFMLEQVEHDPGTGFWRKGLGYLFMHMLGRLEYYLQDTNIPFFWDERSNLISRLSSAEIKNIQGRVTFLRRQLELALSKPDKDIADVMVVLFGDSQKAKEPASGSQRAERSCEHFVPEVRDVQLAESTDWAAVFGVTAVTLGALVLAGRALWPNQNNQ